MGKPKSPYLDGKQSPSKIAQAARWLEASTRAEENRIGEAQEPFVSCTVLAGNPVSASGKVYQPGQNVQLRYTAAQRLQAQGRVSIP